MISIYGNMHVSPAVTMHVSNDSTCLVYTVDILYRLSKAFLKLSYLFQDGSDICGHVDDMVRGMPFTEESFFWPWLWLLNRAFAQSIEWSLWMYYIDIPSPHWTILGPISDIGICLRLLNPIFQYHFSS